MKLRKRLDLTLPSLLIVSEGGIFSSELNFAESRVMSRPKVCSNITAKFRVGPCELAFFICCICPCTSSDFFECFSVRSPMLTSTRCGTYQIDLQDRH